MPATHFLSPTWPGVLSAKGREMFHFLLSFSLTRLKGPLSLCWGGQPSQRPEEALRGPREARAGREQVGLPAESPLHTCEPGDARSPAQPGSPELPPPQSFGEFFFFFSPTF